MCGIKMSEIRDLSSKVCIPCQGGVPPLTDEEMSKLIISLNNEWEIIESHHLERVWKFDDFKQALEFTNRMGEICEEQNHHADFELGWGRVLAKIYTHKIDGLVESDFILASKFDKI
jgi:4a-hydroxytetrahydrobiopterin dehydratase|tara:strand:+ start:73 stop:423 length:351 start_codon:yes stop_codon:yes gene_type:complete